MGLRLWPSPPPFPQQREQLSNLLDKHCLSPTSSPPCVSPFFPFPFAQLVMIVIEDLQWVDSGTLDMLLAFLEAGQEGPWQGGCMFLLSTRPASTFPQHLRCTRDKIATKRLVSFGLVRYHLLTYFMSFWPVQHPPTCFVSYGMPDGTSKNGSRQGGCTLYRVLRLARRSTLRVLVWAE